MKTTLLKQDASSQDNDARDGKIERERERAKLEAQNMTTGSLGVLHDPRGPSMGEGLDNCRDSGSSC
jgi:hypothetical protein